MINKMTQQHFQLKSVGIVHSELKDVRDCPHQEREGAPEAWIEIASPYADALDGLDVGDEILIFTWMHLADRSRLRVHPRGNRNNPVKGVFATRSPHRPNPIGMHVTRIAALEAPSRIKVASLEVIDGTPVLDIKSVISKADESKGRGPDRE